VDKTNAAYFPNPGFVGTDTFTFAAYDGSKDSGLATGTVVVAQGPFSLTVAAHVPPTYPAGWPAAFAAVPATSNTTAAVTFDWDFGDGSPHSTNQFPVHAYGSANIYNWSVVASVSGVNASANGSITISAPVVLTFATTGNQLVASWPNTIGDALLEETATLGPAAEWTWVTNAVTSNSGQLQVSVPMSESNMFFRIRRP
jgi:PKD repeat protein